MIDPDYSSHLARRAFRYCFGWYPMRTSLGCLAGLMVCGLLHALSDIIPIHMDTISYLGITAGGMFAFLMPAFIQTNRLPEHIEQEFEVIRRASELGQLSAVQRRGAYNALIHRVIRSGGPVRSLKSELASEKE